MILCLLLFEFVCYKREYPAVKTWNKNWLSIYFIYNSDKYSMTYYENIKERINNRLGNKAY